MALEYALRVAGSLGLTVELIIHKVTTHNSSYKSCFYQSDRPSSQYWNAGMVAGHSDLARKFGICISHLTEQSNHNKVDSYYFIVIFVAITG